MFLVLLLIRSIAGHLPPSASLIRHYTIFPLGDIYNESGDSSGNPGGPSRTTSSPWPCGTTSCSPAPSSSTQPPRSSSGGESCKGTAVEEWADGREGELQVRLAGALLPLLVLRLQRGLGGDALDDRRPHRRQIPLHHLPHSVPPPLLPLGTGEDG